MNVRKQKKIENDKNNINKKSKKNPFVYFLIVKFYRI